jgi:hypothetical protein
VVSVADASNQTNSNKENAKDDAKNDGEAATICSDKLEKEVIDNLCQEHATYSWASKYHQHQDRRAS